MRQFYLTPGEMSARRGSIPSLDGLRASSILLVLFAHFVNKHLFPGGLGVYVFFVISGFLITRLLLAEQADTGTISLKMFYIRRICRLYPVIVVFSGCIVLLHILLGRPFNFIEPAAALGYFTNYLNIYLDSHGIASQMPFRLFWSLSLEEHFYILFPVTFVLFRGDPIRLMWLVTALCVGCLLLRLGEASLHPDMLNGESFYILSQYRLDSIGFGVLLALACQTTSGRSVLLRLTHPVFLAAALMVIVATLIIRDPSIRETWRYSLQGPAIAIILSAVLFGERYHLLQWFFNLGVLQWIGRLSYSLYVWHQGVASVLPVDRLPAWQQSTIYLIASFAVAAISYYTVEKPFLKLRGHLLHQAAMREAIASG